MTSGTPEASVPLNTSRDLYAAGRKLDDIIRRLDALETRGDFVFKQVRAHDPNRAAFPTGFTESLVSLVDVPRGFTQCQVFIGASAGQTGTGASNIGVWPKINDAYTPETALSNGSPGAGAVTVSSFDSQLVTGLAPGSTIKLAAWCAANGAIGAGSANAHISASLLFLR